MYARITRVQGPPERIDDITEAFTSSALPAMRKLAGYAGASLAVDRASGDGQAVTFWESQEALTASEQPAQGIRTQTVQAGGGQVSSVQRLEIAFMERVTQPSTPAYLRVMRAKAEPSKLDAMTAATRDTALPVLRTLDGFRALLVGVDRASGDVVITGVWASAEAREASEARMADIRTEIFALGGSHNPEISRYEVLAVEFVGVGAART